MPETAINRFREIRLYTESLVSNLSDADMTVQSMPDASPAKWHLAHTTWFFETFILKSMLHDYQEFDPDYAYLFNSYYESVGERHTRAYRGLITRPDKAEVLAYRTYVDEAMFNLIDAQYGSNNELSFLLELGLNHEQQHQELLLTDILHLFAQNPIRPAYQESEEIKSEFSAQQWVSFKACTENFGHDFSMNGRFAYDNEGPYHQVYVPAYEISSSLVSNAEWLEFIKAGGYQNPLLWLSDGWAVVEREQWTSPLHWQQNSGKWHEMTLSGMQSLDMDAPVRHISYFEADAFASWRRQQEDGIRLPTEYEWEHAASSDQLQNVFGQVWQWTKSPYVAYPGFKIAEGAVGEYNGKFMCNQFVLRGSSSATSPGHERLTYRNFFYPYQRWQFSGLRLAKDV